MTTGKTGPDNKNGRTVKQVAKDYVGLRLEPELLAWVDEQARLDNVSRTQIIVMCIEEQKADLEGGENGGEPTKPVRRVQKPNLPKVQKLGAAKTPMYPEGETERLIVYDCPKCGKEMTPREGTGPCEDCQERVAAPKMRIKPILLKKEMRQAVKR